MKYLRLFIISIMLLLFQCHFDQYTRVTLINKNTYPVSVTLRTNNIVETFETVGAGQTVDHDYKWTGINEKEGVYFFQVKNESTGHTDTFSHGHYYPGELGNLLSLEMEGARYEIHVDN